MVFHLSAGITSRFLEDVNSGEDCIFRSDMEIDDDRVRSVKFTGSFCRTWTDEVDLLRTRRFSTEVLKLVTAGPIIDMTVEKPFVTRQLGPSAVIAVVYQTVPSFLMF